MEHDNYGLQCIYYNANFNTEAHQNKVAFLYACKKMKDESVISLPSAYPERSSQL